MVARLIRRYDLSSPITVIVFCLYKSGRIDFLDFWHNHPFGHRWLIGDVCKPRGSINIIILSGDTLFSKSVFIA